MSCELIVRKARSSDLLKRQEIVRSAFSTGFWDTFVYFFFQELTLECCVLSGAVLFIFCGVSVRGCLLLLPAAAAVVSLAVLLQQYTLAQKHAESISRELFGVVAEARGALSPPPGPLAFTERLEESERDHSNSYSHIVGTASISEFWGPTQSGWLHSLAVDLAWQRRGAGAALGGAARRAAARAGLATLECVLSGLQRPAQRLLHAQGSVPVPRWECRGSGERALVGPALTLPLLRLGVDLPLA